MTTDTSPTLYDALQLPRGASVDEVRAAYRRLAREHHPDRAGADGQAMALINQAYEVLSDPQRRARYDQRLDRPRPAPRRPGRVVLPGDRRRSRLAWGLAGIGVLAAAVAVIAGLRGRDGADARRAALEPLSHPLQARETPAPAGADDTLRLIPSRSMAAPPARETAARSR